MTYAELAAMSREELNRTPCECVSCDECRGTGVIRVDMFTGGPDPGDDMYELDACLNCHSRGTVETCDRCHLLDELDVGESL